jgi:hypothetical protein
MIDRFSPPDILRCAGTAMFLAYAVLNWRVVAKVPMTRMFAEIRERPPAGISATLLIGSVAMFIASYFVAH